MQDSSKCKWNLRHSLLILLFIKIIEIWIADIDQSHLSQIWIYLATAGHHFYTFPGYEICTITTCIVVILFRSPLPSLPLNVIWFFSMFCTTTDFSQKASDDTILISISYLASTAEKE